jgi:hypothetical protein
MRKSARLPARFVVLALAAQGAASLAAVSPAAADGTWAPKVSAVYKLRMLGMDLATFQFTSSVTGDTYVLSGHGKMTWALGLFKYDGTFSGSGRINGDRVQPATYSYDWKVNRKAGSVRMAYAGGAIKSVELEPPHTPGPEVVPLKPEHLRAALDPLTSLIAMSRHRGGNPCDRKIAIFEGKQRFDVELTPLREERVTEPKPSGQPVTAHVCRARYTPVAGHKMNRETQAAIKAEGIEVALRPVPAANLVVPYRIVLPTPLGSAVMTAAQVEITAPGNRVIALSH